MQLVQTRDIEVNELRAGWLNCAELENVGYLSGGEARKRKPNGVSAENTRGAR
jgi:hypothetical protein